MNENLFWTFVILNAINVIIQTIKNLCTIKCKKFTAAIVNALAYGFYTVVVIYMICDLPLIWKVSVVGICNFVGVFIVKWIEEKLRKTKLWKIEATISPLDFQKVKNELDCGKIPFNYIDLRKYIVINAYCETQKQSSIVKKILDIYNAKYFVSESKDL